MAQRRERERAQQALVPEEVRVARMIARSAADVDSALDAEAWASHLLGTFREQRHGLPFPDAVEVDPALLFGEPLVTRLATFGDSAAMVALASLAEVDGGELGVLAAELLAGSTPVAGVPRWVEQIGASEVVGAAVMSEAVFDDARTVLLESRHPDGETMVVGVLIDRNLGGLAKDVLLAESIEQVAGAMGRYSSGEEAELELERIEPGVAAGLIRAAIARTDMTWDPPVDEDFWSGRALALLRVDQTLGVVEPPELAELSSEERDRLRDEFLSSPEGRGFAPDGDEAWVASLAIDFCAGYTDGDPLRWSPVVVELFMADWIPRKVLATPELLDRLPAALDAWVRFAARRRGIPDWAANETRESIVEWVEEMVDAALDPAVGGPSKQFLLAAKAAGVDLEDEQAVGAFIEGWNARSELDLADLEVAQAIEPDEILQLKITLKGISKPPVWRRVQVRADTTFAMLHQIIQAAFGWTDTHLHSFEYEGERIGVPDLEWDNDCAGEAETTLDEVLLGPKDRVRYTYDFGDNWEHDIVLEKVLDPDASGGRPALLTGKGARPPEDCGGPWGYAELKDTGGFDPASFDLEPAQRRVRAAGR
ncbi:MAG TPA: plasmid pRiA4b ORF-3 family protein [Solirubrobacteraceae bacterium]|nr:plasmid pRiA4b ORF-3 family protein [Solirubrobacteraceae bacterium]